MCIAVEGYVRSLADPFRKDEIRSGLLGRLSTPRLETSITTYSSNLHYASQGVDA